MRHSLKFKQKSVSDALIRIAKIDVQGMMPIIASPADKYYRNKLEYTFSNKRWLMDGEARPEEPVNMDALGFHIPGRFDKILQIEHCYLQADPSNAIRNSIDEFAKREGYSYYDLKQHTGALRNLIIRTSSTGELMVIVVFAYATEEEIEKLMNLLAIPSCRSLHLLIHRQPKKERYYFRPGSRVAFRGPEYIYEEMMEGIKFRIGPNPSIKPIQNKRINYTK